ncbi:HmuY family protein [Bacteroidota bacterium]
MNRNIQYFILFITTIFIVGCFEEDERILPIEIDEIDIPYSMYEYQTYYSITDQSIVSYHNYSDWDLGFESSENGYHIILNYARFMYAGNTFSKDFYSIETNIANEMSFDHSSGNLDSTILSDWTIFSDPKNPEFTENVYIIDRGKNELGEEYGLKKVVFEKLETDTFYIHYANLDNTKEYYFKVPKDPRVNFTLFSFDDGGKLTVQEPDKSSWDICFTKYSTIIPDNFGTPTDYLVRGVYLNPFKEIEVALDTSNYFYEINGDLMTSYEYSSKQDAIGYDWKEFTNDFYEVKDYHTYILKDIEEIDYKLRFTRFYNKDGVKGYPSFELKQF